METPFIGCSYYVIVRIGAIKPFPSTLESYLLIACYCMNVSVLLNHCSNYRRKAVTNWQCKTRICKSYQLGCGQSSIFETSSNQYNARKDLYLVCASLCSRSHGKLVTVCFANNDCTCCLESSHCCGIKWRHIMLKNTGTCRTMQSLRANGILHSSGLRAGFQCHDRSQNL